MIFLVQLVCVHGHPNAGIAHQYATDEPTDEWLHQVCHHAWQVLERHPDGFTECITCHEPFSDRWSLSVSRTKFLSVAHAEEVLGARSILLEDKV
jgi:hypothetical protein